jgi:tripartite-type tricarboxylate transporter receptor subunit TctC
MAFCLAASCIASSAAAADAYPSRLVTVVVPYPAGGASDLFARIVAKGWSTRLGQSFIVVNRAGAAGRVGGQVIAKAAPDGYNLLITNEAPITTLAVGGGEMPYDPINDFTPISIAAAMPFYMVVRSDLGAASVAELIKLAKSKPEALTYGTTGIGGVSHLVTEELSTISGIKLFHIPFKGGAEGIAQLIAGRIDIFLTMPTTALPHLNNAKVRIMAVASTRRSPRAPGVPTFAEEGVPNFVFGSWFGVLGPGKLPKDIVAKLHASMVEVLQAPDTNKFLDEQGAYVVASSPEQAAATIESDIARWRKLAKTANIVVR